MTQEQLDELKTGVSYGPMHLCRFKDCEVWVADGGDHRCVLHSNDEYAIEMRTAFVCLETQYDDPEDEELDEAYGKPGDTGAK